MNLNRGSLVTVLLVLAALVLGTVITDRLPSVADVTDRPFVHTGMLGQPVTQRTGTFTVLGVQATRNVDSVINGVVVSSLATNGIFAVLRIEVTGRGEPLTLATQGLSIVAPDGREFGGAARGTQACGPAQPGMTLVCTVAVETVPDALAGAHLRIPAQSVGFVSPPELELADIDLAITAAQAQALAASSARIQLTTPTPKGA